MKEESQIDHSGFIGLKETRSWTGCQLKSYPDAFSVCQSYYLSILFEPIYHIYPACLSRKQKLLIPHTEYGDSQLITMFQISQPVLFTSMGSFLQ